MSILPYLLRAFGPALPLPRPTEALRAGLGAGLGLGLTAFLLWQVSPGADGLLAHPALIAPFGASAFLIFSVPNSPLAQPFSVVMGNTLSALSALLVLHAQLPLLPTAMLAVALAVLAMNAARALHPPGGAAALLIALSPPVSGWSFALSPVMIGSLALVLAGIVWNRATGRVYPFRQPAASPHGTSDPAPDRRHLPPPGALAELLHRLRLDANIGVEDLTRLITASEAEAATRPLAGLTAAHLMSRDLVTVLPETPLAELVDIFHHRHFKTLPVAVEGRYVGLVAEEDLLGCTDPDLTAADLAHVIEPALQIAPAGELVHRLSDGGQQAVPIVEAGRLLGLVTRSDLIALLARSF